MRKMNKRKTGFTLIEIIIVVSIIVVLSTAAFVGASQVIDRANKNAEDLEAHNGKNFEPNAWNTVKNLSVDVDEFSATSASSITSSTDETTPSPTPTPDPNETIAYKDINEIMDAIGSPNEKDQEWLDKRQELLDYGYLPDEITIYIKDGHITGLSYGTNRKGFAPTHTPKPKPTMPEKNIQPGVLGSSTKQEEKVSNAQYGASTTLIFDNSIKNADTVTVVYFYDGTEISDVIFNSINTKPSVTIDNGLITLEFDLTQMQEWEVNSMVSGISPTFFTESQGSTTLTIVEVQTT